MPRPSALKPPAQSSDGSALDVPGDFRGRQGRGSCRACRRRVALRRPASRPTIATAVWKVAVCPDSGGQHARGWRSRRARLAEHLSPSAQTWSEPITSAPGCRLATARALASASRTAWSRGDSPGGGVSSTSGASAVEAASAAGPAAPCGAGRMEARSTCGMVVKRMFFSPRKQRVRDGKF